MVYRIPHSGAGNWLKGKSLQSREGEGKEEGNELVEESVL